MPLLLDRSEWRLAVSKSVRNGVSFLVNSLRVEAICSREDELWIVSDGLSTVYGDGVTVEEAEQDYLDCLTGHFVWLLDHEATLGVGLKNELSRLRSLMVRG